MSMVTRFDCVLTNSESERVIEFFSVIVIIQGINSSHSNSNQCSPTPCWNFVVKKIQVSSSECSWKKQKTMLFRNRVCFSSCGSLKKKEKKKKRKTCGGTSHLQSKGIGMAQRWERWPPTNVARVWFQPGVMWVECFVGSGLAPRVFLRVFRFSSLHEIPTRPG